MAQRNTDKDYRTVIAFCEALDSNPMVDTDKQMLVDLGLRNALRKAGWFVSVVDRAPIFDKDTLLHAFYQAGQFPGYFGFNWDALLDTFCDLSWLGDVNGIALIWRNPSILAARSPDVFTTFGEVLAEANSTRWRKSLAPLRILAPRVRSAGL